MVPVPVPGRGTGVGPGRGDGPGPAGSPAPKSCPSALCEEDALLLGVVGPDGAVAYLQPPTRVSADFVRQAQARGRPERSFRFSAPCREAGCPQWTGQGCGVIDIMIGSRPEEPATEPATGPTAGPGAGPGAVRGAHLPACGIRRTCRWFAQRGAAACGVCPLIVADAGGTQTYQSMQLATGDEAVAGPGTDTKATDRNAIEGKALDGKAAGAA